MKSFVYLVYETKTPAQLPCGLFETCSAVALYLGCSTQTIWNAFSASGTDEIILRNYCFGIIRILSDILK